MATPLSPLLHGQALLDHLKKLYPQDTPEELLELAQAFGFDLTTPPSATSSTPTSTPSKTSPE